MHGTRRDNRSRKHAQLLPKDEHQPGEKHEISIAARIFTYFSQHLQANICLS
jgi:hypothetical protein